MVIIWLNISDGLGNQVYQYMFVSDLKYKLQQKGCFVLLVLDDSIRIRKNRLDRKFLLDYIFDINKYLFIENEKTSYRLKKIVSLIFKKVTIDDNNYHTTDTVDSNTLLNVRGYFQGISKYSFIHKTIKLKFKFNLGRLVKYLKEELIIVVHIRVGDFVGTDDFLGYDYYKNEYLLNKELHPNARYLLLTDDPSSLEFRKIESIFDKQLNARDLGLIKKIITKEVNIKIPVEVFDFYILLNAPLVIRGNSTFASSAHFIGLVSRGLI